MKKITLTLMVALISVFAYAQEKGTQDFVINVGFLSSNDFLNTLDNIIEGIEGATFDNTTASPAITVGYKRAIKNKWFFYADGVYQSINEDVFVSGVKVGDVSHRYLTFGFGTEYHYISKEWFQIYSGASIAYTKRSSDFTTTSSSFEDVEDVNDGFFNFQVNALGLRVGKAFAGTLEVGVGYRGIVNLGLSYQF